MVCELSDKEAAALNVKSLMRTYGREGTYEKLARERISEFLISVNLCKQPCACLSTDPDTILCAVALSQNTLR